MSLEAYAPRGGIGSTGWAVCLAYWRVVFAGLLLTGFVLLCSVYPLNVKGDQFNTPDEGGNYFFTRHLAEHGNLCYSPDYVHLDQENLLHPRAAITQGDCVVPQYYLGLPVLYAPLYKIAGDNIQFLSVVFALACAWALYRTANLAFGAAAWQVWAPMMACTPLIYYLNRAFMNVAPALTFGLIGLWLATRYAREGRRSDLFLASALFGLSMLCRYEYVLFLTPLLLGIVALKHRPLLTRRFFSDVLLSAGIVGLTFALPVMVLNKLVYGESTTYGISLFNDWFYPERTSETAASPIVSMWREIRGILLPSYSIKLELVAQNLVRLIGGLTPILLLTAGFGALIVLRKRSHLPAWSIPAAVALLAYLVMYRASSDFWNSEGSEPSFDVSIVRYWLILYIALLFLGAYALTKLRLSVVKAVLVVGLLVTGPLSVYSTHEGSLTWLTESVNRSNEWVYTQLLPNTEENAIVYAGRRDKAITPYRDVAAWWNGEEFYDPSAVANSMAKIVATGRPVYLYREPEVDLGQLRVYLTAKGLEAETIRGTALVRIKEAE